jgi:hypothetical protein
MGAVFLLSQILGDKIIFVLGPFEHFGIIKDKMNILLFILNNKI